MSVENMFTCKYSIEEEWKISLKVGFQLQIYKNYKCAQHKLIILKVSYQLYLELYLKKKNRKE